MQGLRILLLLACGVSVTPALAVDCRRSADLPKEIARRQLDCRGVSGGEAPTGNARRSLSGEKGFIDLGNGTSVRISGRVRADTLYRR
jgi:hypothetical protein